MSTYPKGVEIVRLVHQLNKKPNRIELQDIMYLLYWRGLPIDDTKLFYQLLEYQRCLVVKMNTVANDRSADPEEVKEKIKEKIKENVAKGLRKVHFKPGAPFHEFHMLPTGQGNGSIVMSYLIEYAKRYQIHSITGILSSPDKHKDTEFTPAIRFYKRHGFQITFNEEMTTGIHTLHKSKFD